MTTHKMVFKKKTNIIRVDPKRAGGKLTKKKQEEVTKFMADLFEEGKLGKYTLAQLSEMLKINPGTASRYRKKIYIDCKPFDLDALKKRSNMLFERLERNMLSLIDKAEEFDDTKGKLIVLERAPKFLKDYTTFLEDYGFKQKAAEQIHVIEEKVHIHINLPEIENAKD